MWSDGLAYVRSDGSWEAKGKSFQARQITDLQKWDGSEREETGPQRKAVSL